MRIRVAPVATFVAIGLVLASCASRQEVARLADAGIQAGESLSDYYGSLLQDVTETKELEVYNSSLRGNPPDDRGLAELDKTVAALRARQAMATEMENAYISLKSLAAYDASGEVQSAASSLASTVQHLPVLPQGGLDPSALIGNIAGDIVAIKQHRDMLKAVKTMQKEMAVVDKLFQSEKRGYQSIIDERNNKVTIVADHLVDLGYLGTSSLLEEVPASVGLSWAGPSVLAEDNDKRAAKELLHTRLSRFSETAASATGGEAQVLSSLLSSESALLAHEGNVSITDLQTFIKRANTYLDEWSKLRKNAVHAADTKAEEL